VNDFAIITNRKRAVIALAHSIVFLLIALRGLASASTASPIWLRNPATLSSVLILLIYVVVASVLIQLVRISGCAREKLYFGFCASSATLGLLRAVFGDPGLHPGQLLKVIMLICAVTTGTAILRGHSRVAAENAL
jgi:hypothetical protein